MPRRHWIPICEELQSSTSVEDADLEAFGSHPWKPSSGSVHCLHHSHEHSGEACNAPAPVIKSDSLAHEDEGPDHKDLLDDEDQSAAPGATLFPSPPPPQVCPWASSLELHDTKISRAPRDSSLNWLNEFRANSCLELHELPSLEKLADFVRLHALPVRLDMGHDSLAGWLEDGLSSWTHNRLFVQNDEKPNKTFQRILDNMLVASRYEDSKNTPWNTVIHDVLSTVLPDTDLYRPASEASFGQHIVADFVCILSEVCVLRGLERLAGFELHQMQHQLCHDLEWIFGDVPYLFGYTVSGHTMELFALVRGGFQVVDEVKTVSIGVYDWAQTDDRFGLVLALLNMCLLVPALAEHCPAAGRREYHKIYCGRGISVQLYPTFVEKSFPDSGIPNHLERVYEALRASEVPNVDCMVLRDSSTQKLVLEPRGSMMQKPRDLRQLFNALRNVLEALVALHRARWMHRDIRWPNVIKRRDRDGWFLIDFEDAAPTPQKWLSGLRLSEAEHAPEIHDPRVIQTPDVDLWSVGYLIISSGLRMTWYSDQRRARFCESLIQRDATKRPTARTALEELMRLPLVLGKHHRDDHDHEHVSQSQKRRKVA